MFFRKYQENMWGFTIDEEIQHEFSSGIETRTKIILLLC